MKINSSEVAEKTQAHFIDAGKPNVSVSIITSVYNAEQYLEETIKSVIGQTFKNFEYILVNDASTDNSLDIMQRYEKQDKRIRIIQLENNSGGPARPRNIGIENAKGEYIAFLDSDDVWMPKKLEKQIKILEECDDIDMVHSFAYTIDTKSEVIGFFNNQKTFNKLKFFMNPRSILYISNYININTAIIRNNMNIRFREDKFLVALEDWAFWMDYKSLGKKEYLIKENLIYYRVDMNSISDRKSDKSYKKAFYLYTLLLNEERISLREYVLNTFINTIKIIIKNIKLKIYS